MRVKISSVLTGLFGLVMIASCAVFIALLAHYLRSNALNELNSKFRTVLQLNEKILAGVIERNKALTAALSDDFMVVKAFVDLRSGFKSSNINKIAGIFKPPRPDRSSILMGKGEELYEFMHEAHHAQVAKYLKTSPFSDLLLVSLDGQVIYSYQKQDEFSKNVADPDLQNNKIRNLRKAVSQLTLENNIASAIFEIDKFNYGILSVTKIAIEGKNGGYAVTVTPFSYVNKQLNDVGVLGQTGAIILTLPGGRPIAWKGLDNQSIRNWTVPEGLLNSVSDAQSISRAVQINKQSYHAILKPVRIDQYQFRLILQQANFEIIQNSDNLLYKLILVGIIILCVALLVVIYTTRQISQPLAKVSSELVGVTSGDISDISRIESRFIEIKNISDSLVTFRGSVVERLKLEKKLVDRSLEMEALNDEFKHANKELEQYRDHLEDLVKSRTEIIEKQSAKLEEALAAEKELNDLQRSFVSMASHEFRTPLAIIDTIAQKILRRPEGMTEEKLVEHGTKIRGAVRRMTSLMESTLSAARLENGKIRISIKPCDVKHILTECSRTQKELTPDHEILLDIDDAPDSIMADSTALEQIVTNLLSNAVKYSPDTAEVALAATQDKQNIYISVKDGGLGIDEEDLPKMFTRFFRAKTSTGISGTGIGLNLCKMLIEEHGGEIKLESKKGYGSTFTVCLPIG